MTLEQLRIFVFVADRGHMTLGAELLGISQSAASSSIRALENQYSVQLFNRVGRGIELSRAGVRFLVEAKAVLERADAARLVLESVSQTISGKVSLAASQTIANYWLPRRLAAFRHVTPALQIDVKAGNTYQVEQAVLDGSADIGLVEGRTQSQVLRRKRVDIDRLILVVGRNAPATLMKKDGCPDLRALSWVVRERGSGTRQALEDLAAQNGASFDELQIFLVLPSNEAVRQAVESGTGATIISEHVVARSLAEGALRHIPLALPPREYAMITHCERKPNAAQNALKEHLRRTQL